MSKTINISSPTQFSHLVSTSTIVVADFYADWCGPCRAIAPLYEQLSSQLSAPQRITFTKINTDTQQAIAQSYNISAMPTFVIFKAGREVHRVRGADQAKLSEAVRRLAREAESAAANGAGSAASGVASGTEWRAFEPPKQMSDITDQVDVRGLDVLNADGEFGTARSVFETSRPSCLSSTRKGKEAKGTTKDWLESDTDDQLMLYVPMMATAKIHSLQITSSPDPDADEPTGRPSKIKLFTNRAHNLGFEEAEDSTATQELEIPADAWDEETRTAKVDLRFVKFQNVTSLVLFVVKGDGEAERTRIDRVRVIGETGVKRDLGKLEKVGHEE